MAANFAPYQPPPPGSPVSVALGGGGGTGGSSKRYFAPPSSSSSHGYEGGYQSGSTTLFDADAPVAGDPGAEGLSGASGSSSGGPSWGLDRGGPPGTGRGLGGAPNPSSYATTHGYSLSILCATPYLVPPLTSFALLLFEVENDLARFHAYQSALIGICLFLAELVLFFLFGWRTLGWIVAVLGFVYSWYCGLQAHRTSPTLARVPYLPTFGELADRWVSEE